MKASNHLTPRRAKMSYMHLEASSMYVTQHLRLKTVKQILADQEYQWVTNSYLRHVIFNAEDRYGSGGTKIEGNGLAPAIIRIGRKVLIDMNQFDCWVEKHRMGQVCDDTSLPCNTSHIGKVQDTETCI